MNLIRERLILRIPLQKDAESILNFYQENKDFLTPWEPQRPENFYQFSYWDQIIKQIEQEFNQNIIPELRSKKKITHQALTDELGVTRATITYIEKGNYNTSLDLVFRISTSFNKNIHQIFFLEVHHE